MIKLLQQPTLVSVDDLLNTARRDQHNLSAVERFARLHDAGEVPAQKRYYKTLLPAAIPGPDEQFAFEVDLDRCTACKACVTACHNLNGLAHDEAWRNTGLLVGGTQGTILHSNRHHRLPPLPRTRLRRRMPGKCV